MPFVVYTIRFSIVDAKALAQIARSEDRSRADMLRALIRRQYRQLAAGGTSGAGTQQDQPATQLSREA